MPTSTMCRTTYLRPGSDYPVWRSHLPGGYVVMDAVKIEFA